MDPFTFVLLAFATYRVTRYWLLDSMIEDTRDRLALLAQRKRRAAADDKGRWAKVRHLLWRKAEDGSLCAFCVSFWVGIAWLVFWAAISDYDLGWVLVLHAFALAGAAMLVYRIIDPPED